MKKKIAAILLLISLITNGTAQDTCKPVLPKEDEGFSHNIRLDTKTKFLENLFDSGKYKFTFDYAGTLSSPSFLFNEANFSGYDLLSTNFTFSDKNNVQKVAFTPFRLFEKIDNNLLRNTSLGITLKNSITTFGMSIGGNYSDPRIKGSRGDKFKKWRDTLLAKAKYEIPQMYPKECQEKIIQQNAREAANTLYLYDSMRTRHVFSWNAGYSVQLFQLLSSRAENRPDLDSLNYFGFKANIASINVGYGFLNGKFQFNAGYSNMLSRKGTDKSQKKITYNIYKVAASVRILSLLKGEKLKQNTEFIKSRFVPGIHLGVSYDYKTTKGDYKFVEEGIITSGGYTPFIQFLVTPASQFSIGFPIVKSKTITDIKTSQVAAVLQYKFSLSNLGN